MAPLAGLQNLLITIIFICYHIDITLGCSAINSYVQITSPTDLQQTILSSQALFAPYNYYINSSELVELDDSNDDICSAQLSTNIENKIVLIQPSNGDCANTNKIYGAQLNGAIAVLLVSDEEETGSVSSIINDNDAIETRIPTRMIPYNSGSYLSKQLNIDTNLPIMIEFGCQNESNISSILCVVDKSGDHWWMDGDYQLQIGKTKNGHSIWMKDGYLLVLDVNHYIFLHSGNGTQEWYWAITEDPKMENDLLIVAKCGEGGIDNPIHCTAWFTTDYFMTEQYTFSLNPNLKFNNTLCEITDNKICIQSSKSTLAGLYGTYRQFNANAPYWFREWVDCDTQSGYLTFRNFGDRGEFWLVDPFDGWIVAECIITGYSPSELANTIAFRPDKCKNWSTLIDGSLDSSHKVYDGTMSVTMDTCGDYDCSQDFVVPNEICMGRNSIMHSFLEGDYIKTGVRGNKYNTSEWIRKDLLYYGDGEYVPVYLWYYGEVNSEYNWWVIANSNLSTAQQLNGSSVYGFCPSSTNSPTNCVSCWNFYFSGDVDIVGAWHADCQFEMIDQECDSDTGGIHYEWPDYLCIRDNVSDDYSGDVDFNLLIGGYEINTTLTQFSGVPYYIKPPNKYNENYTYIFYDGFYGYWQIDDKLHVDSILICMQETDEYLPTECDDWYDKESNHAGNMFLYSDGCDANDILTLSENEEKSNNAAIIAVLVVLAIMALCIAAFFYFRNYQKNNKKGPWTATKVTIGGVGSSDDGIEMGNDTTGLVGESPKGGGLDMSPLNDELADDQLPTYHDVDDDDDDDEMSIDEQQNKIVDDGDDGDDGDDDDDDEERLITGNGNITDGNNDDDLRLPSDNEEDIDPDIEDADKKETPQQQYTTSIMDE